MFNIETYAHAHNEELLDAINERLEASYYGNFKQNLIELALLCSQFANTALFTLLDAYEIDEDTWAHLNGVHYYFKDLLEVELESIK